VGIHCSYLEELSSKRDLTSVDGIEAIVAAMKKYPEVSRITMSTFGALINLGDLKDNANLMVNEFCISPFVIERMKHFLGLGELGHYQRASCMLLGNLSHFEGPRKTLIESNADVVLSKIFKRPRITEEAKKKAHEVLRMLWSSGSG
jgi:hypothetical protein